MRINREILLKIAVDTVERRTRGNRDILSVYLIGSLLDENPLLGGATDIDLVLIWNGAPPLEREIEPLTEQVHVDIAHHSRTLYRQARRLRQHPWLGPDLARGKVLYDPQHFLDFTQASVRGQFNDAENVMERAVRLAEASRQAWLGFAARRPGFSAGALHEYLDAVENAGNAVVSLDGVPLTERRFLASLHKRTADKKLAGIYPMLTGLIGGPAVTEDRMRGWLPEWTDALVALQERAGATVSPHRRGYYALAVQALLESEHPEAAMWPMLRVWTRLAAAAGQESEVYKGWLTACRELGLADEGFGERIAALDVFLDRVEETVEEWGKARGVA